MKQKQEKLETLKELLRQKIYLRNKNEREKDRLMLGHYECLRKDEIHSLDIISLENQIEQLEKEIEKEASSSIFTRIYRIQPLTGARIFIELTDETGEKKHQGILYYNDMSASFKERVCVERFDEAFTNISCHSLIWRISCCDYDPILVKTIPELLSLIR
jgi:hypothetical protein